MARPAAVTRQPAAPPSLLEPTALAKLSRLELVSTQVMDGYVQGLHRSPHVGYSLDFAQHRSYVPGDDIKRIDWRVYAKADRYYIKQYEVSTNLRAYLLLDASGSMAYRGRGEALSKFRYAQFAAACLGYLVLNQQDALGLATFDDDVRTFLPAKTAPTHLMHVIRSLEQSATGGEGAIAPRLNDLAERLPRRSMVIVLSDLLDDADQLTDALHHLRHRRHEVLLMQVMSGDELTFPFSKWSLFESLERVGQRVRLDPAMARATYLENLARHQKALRDACGRLRVSHVLLDSGKPFDTALTAYLAARMGWR